MNVLLDMYLNKNLGDDLFLEIILKRYKNHNFYISPLCNYDIKYKNVKSFRNVFTRIINILEKKLKFRHISIMNLLKKKCDCFVVLGGSMFIEPANNNLNLINNKYFSVEKPYFILGSNFGPYKNKEFYETYKNVFKNSYDTCFRDEYSYELFSSLSNVRFSSDIVFSLDISGIKNDNNDTVVISVIDLSKREDLKHLRSIYEGKIISLISYFVKTLNLSVILMSFCKNEGDETAVNRIYDSLNDELKNSVNKYFYRGDIDDALNTIGSSKIVVGTRFHANILGMLLGKTVIPIAYSDKTLNALKDINYSGKILDIRDANNFDVRTITEDDLKYKINIEEQKKSALNQFAILDKFLKREGE